MPLNLLELITIDRRSTIHFNIQLKENIKSLILDQTFYYHTKLPVPNELAKNLSIEEKIVLSAYDLLIKEGFIRKTASDETYEVSFFELTNYFFKRNVAVYDAIIALGLKPSIRCLDKKTVTLKRNVIESMGFGTEKSNKFFYINRVYSGNEQPIMILENYLPISVFPDICDNFKEEETLDSYISNYFDLKEVLSKRSVKAVNLCQKTASILNERKNSASFQSTNHMYDKDKRLIAYGRSHTIGSYYFQALITKDMMHDYFPNTFKYPSDNIEKSLI